MWRMLAQVGRTKGEQDVTIKQLIDLTQYLYVNARQYKLSDKDIDRIFCLLLNHETEGVTDY